MKKILLVGNPNVGKSVFFTRLTGVNVISSNYPGTTVDFTRGYLHTDDEKMEIIDVPGTYSLDPENKAEEVAVKMIDEGDVIVNVINSCHLERSLYLTLQLLSLGKPLVVALNLWDRANKNGVHINSEKLEEILGVPVVPTVALTGEGFKNLIDRIKDARSGIKVAQENIWTRVGMIVSEVQTIEHRHYTFMEKLAEATVKPLTGLPLSILILLGAFSFIIFTGNFIIGAILDPLFYNVY